MVRFFIEELEVFFPYENVYPEQLEYMKYLKQILDAHSHGVLEMPTGTGKTVTLLSFITSYQLVHPNMGKLIYCTRTVPEMEKALQELKIVIEYCKKEIENDKIKSEVALRGENESSSPLNSGHPFNAASILGIGMTARRNMCINPRVAVHADRDKIDSMCRSMTAPWVRAKYQMEARERNSMNEGETDSSKMTEIADIEEMLDSGCTTLCPYYEAYERVWNSDLVPTGVYTIDEFKDFSKNWEHPILGKKIQFCPYYASKRLIQTAKIVVLNYQYILDPKVAQASLLGGGTVSQGFSHGANPNGLNLGSKLAASLFPEQEGAKEPSVVVFDEAHNIDNVCIEALSVNMNRQILNGAARNLRTLKSEIENLSSLDEQRLQDEYTRLIQGLRNSGQIQDEAVLQDLERFPVLPDEMEKIRKGLIPGSIRRAEHFITIMKKLILYLQEYIRVYSTRIEGPLTFVKHIEASCYIQSGLLKFCDERLRSLLNTLRIVESDQYSSLELVCTFFTILGSYSKGFIVIVDPYPEVSGLYDPVIQLSCLDSSIAMRPILKRYQSIVLTSGTLSPLDLYPKLLGFIPVISQSLTMTLDRTCICPLIVTRGSDQTPLSSKFESRGDVSIQQNYGKLILEITKKVPDGVVCFFSSYLYMEQMLSQWYESGILAQIMEHKLVFVETKDIVSTTLALHHYRKACDIGRGGIFFSIARGKVAEGIDFDRHYGRCVVMVGIPYQYTLSKILQSRLSFLKENYGIQENEFLTFDAMRQASQCVGRVIRSKADYGLMIFADLRYNKKDKREKIPPWILKHLKPEYSTLSTDMAVSISSNFLKLMSQPYTISKSIIKPNSE
ncbi:DNA repair related protein [Cryptosporidium ubiquitum]|uniref:DNA 5'-3' helicase n=1 Tax=Cryptosporidium ubiquitum TaxID=857276 RepID=A0A1J4MKH9_9CRYT|nr:DNA repair related protein [Cryptosporidium ubiquitum]OII73955.1 DNA repair related protein [Cryptosporidium ubiquitum]